MKTHLLRNIVLALVWQLLGAAIGWLLAALSVAMAGGGHGSIVPAVVFLGVCSLTAEFQEDYFILLGAALYASYAGVLWVGCEFNRRRRCAILVLAFHYLSVLIGAAYFWSSVTYEPVRRVKIVWAHTPVLLCCALGVYLACNLVVLFLVTRTKAFAPTSQTKFAE